MDETTHAILSHIIAIVLITIVSGVLWYLPNRWISTRTKAVITAHAAAIIAWWIYCIIVIWYKS